MPYTVSRNSAGKYCVYKQDDNGDPMGEAMGCHDSQEEAGAQIGAITANEKDMKKAMRLTQDEVNYTAVSVTKGKACSNCRWFDMETGPYCKIIENYPADIVPNGYCDRYEMTPDYEPEPIPVTIVEGQREAAPEPEPEAALYAAPDSNKKSFFKSIAEKFKGGLKPGNTVIRAKDGKRYMFIVTSNSYEDREKETMTTDALKAWVDSCWLADDYFHTDNKHLVWHDDAFEVGDIVWADMAGPFLIEVAREGESIFAKKAYDYFETTDDDLGASHRFAYRTVDRDGSGTYKAIKKIETSTLPRQHAANLLTFSGVLPMSKSRDEYVDKLLGFDGAAAILRESPEKLAKELAAKGVQHKSTEEAETPAPDTTPAEETERAESTFAELVLSIIEGQAATMQAVDDVKALVMADQETRQKEKAAFDDKMAALESENKTLRDEMKLSPRISLTGKEKETAEAEITERNEKAQTNDLLKRMQAAMENGG